MEKINWKIKKNQQLLSAFLLVKNQAEMEYFLRDLMTEKEIEELSNRLEAARLLSNKIQYNTISEKTGLSSTTIARISKWLNGSLGGYRIILKRLHHSNSHKLR
jgi:TrpR-related protein YerC/YecD